MVKTIVLATLLAPALAHAGSVRHVPPAETTAATALEIDADVADAWTSTLTLHYRTIDAPTWSTASFARKRGATWAAEIPAAAIAPPGVEYYIDSVAATGGPATDEFASAAAPHEVRIRRTGDEIRKERDLARVDQKRSRVHVDFDDVDWGDRGGLRDGYYRLDADFAYRLLAYPLEQIRFGYTRMLGSVPSNGAAETVGFKVGGWFEVRLGVTDGVDLDARGMVMATQGGFGVGGRAELRFGIEDGNHVALGVESIQDIGTSAHFRLGWATVPHLPMAATVEVSDMPASSRPAGIRFLYDIAYPVRPGLRIGARVGYQARDATVGGITGGTNVTLDF